MTRSGRATRVDPLHKPRATDHKAAMDALPIFLTLRARPVILIGEGPAAEAKQRLLVRAGARIVDGDDRAAQIAIVAVEDEGRAAILSARLRARGLLVNVVDRPALSDFSFPAIIDRAPVTVAIGTGGFSAGLAKTLRQRLEAWLPAELGGLAKALASARPGIRARWPEADARRRALDAAMAPAGPLDPLSPDGRDGDGAARVSAWLSDLDDRVAPARLVAIRLASSDPEELTLRAHRLLGSADRIYYRPNVSGEILDRARADAERIPCHLPPDTTPPGLSIDLGYA